MEGETGWLRAPDEREWSKVMRQALFEMSDAEIKIMGEQGKQRVEREFSKEKMAQSLQREMFDMLEKDRGVPLVGVGEWGVLMGVLMGIVAMGFWWFV